MASSSTPSSASPEPSSVPTGSSSSPQVSSITQATFIPSDEVLSPPSVVRNTEGFDCPGTQGFSLRALQILEAAKGLFRHYGYEKTTMDDIAREVGIGKGTIYLEFPSKDDILKAIIQLCHQAQLCRMQEIQKTFEAQPDLLLIETMLLERVVDTFDKATNFLHNPETMIYTSYKVKTEMGSFFKERDALLAEVLNFAAQAGLIVPLDHPLDVAHLMFQSLADYFPPYWPGVTRDQVLQGAHGTVRLILRGLSTQNPLPFPAEGLPPLTSMCDEGEASARV